MKTLMICSFVVALAAPLAGFAADKGGVMPMKVSYRGLDLRDPADAALLLRRIDSAATEACGGWVSYNPIDLAIARTSECHDEAMRQAVATVNAPLVSALYGQTVTLASAD